MTFSFISKQLILEIIRARLLVTIRLKWLWDKHFLPLNHQHKELYCIIHKLCWKELKDFPNLIDCRDFNDKIQWLKLFDQDKETVRCSDKVRVREYIQDQISTRHLTQVYQVHDCFTQINFNTLPNTFVIKTNNDSGTVIPVKDKTTMDYHLAKQRINDALKRPYGWDKGEWAYSYIEPKVLIEEFLEPRSRKLPADYKFHCVNGKIKWVQYIFDRGIKTKESIVTPNGTVTSIHFDHKMQHSEDFTRPQNWNEMKNLATKLASPFKYVRVDLYNCKNNIFVGELTFFPLMGCYKSPGQKQLGKLLDFNRNTFKPAIIPKLENKKSRFIIYPDI